MIKLKDILESMFPKDFDRHKLGSCMSAAALTTDYLLNKGIKDFIIVEGWVSFGDDWDLEKHKGKFVEYGNIFAHTWIKFPNGRKFDPTRKQWKEWGFNPDEAEFHPQVKKEYTPQQYQKICKSQPDDISKFKKDIKEIMEAMLPAIPPAIVRPASTNALSQNFIDYIKIVENGQKVGYDTQRHIWVPHQSVEGGMPTIGYGHKIKDKKELDAYKNGISDIDVNNLLMQDLTNSNKHVHDYIKKRYKVNLMLTTKQNEIFTDFAFNLGSLDKFPKFADAVLKNNWNVVKKEYIRNANGKPLKGRNTAFYNRFLK